SMAGAGESSLQAGLIGEVAAAGATPQTEPQGLIRRPGKPRASSLSLTGEGNRPGCLGTHLRGPRGRQGWGKAIGAGKP
uniref:Uncharacterized protein n=1 Tax=Chelonoidis abingdonii TaxID=106734 RepID=A0A8C0HFY4_CHEAB